MLLKLKGKGKDMEKISAVGTVVLKYLPLTFCSKWSTLFCLFICLPCSPFHHSALSHRDSGRKEIGVLLAQTTQRGGRRQRLKAEALLVGSVLRAHRAEEEGDAGKGGGKG